jgi:hypothetical protein
MVTQPPPHACYHPRLQETHRSLQELLYLWRVLGFEEQKFLVANEMVFVWQNPNFEAYLMRSLMIQKEMR